MQPSLAPAQNDRTFLPDAARAARLDGDVRQNLALSLSHVRGALNDGNADDAQTLDGMISAAQTGRIRPGLFALYTDLVEAISALDDEAFRAALRDAKGYRAAHGGGLSAITLRDGDLGAGMTERYLRHVQDAGESFSILPLPQDALREADERLQSTLGLLNVAAPDLAGEIRGLSSEVVFIGSDAKPGEASLDSASTFFLWGALFLNIGVFGNRVSMAEGLAHEGAHTVLHGMLLGDPLVTNSEDERYPSPLRADPRSMEGVVHATYVLARMFYCVDRLLSSNELTPQEREIAVASRANNAKGYAQGLETVAAHARFSPAGEAIFQSARDYMAKALARDFPQFAQADKSAEFTLAK